MQYSRYRRCMSSLHSHCIVRKEKTIDFDNGRLYLTSHRLLYIDANQPYKNSRSLDLDQIKQTEHWAGFLKSSAKITLVLGDAGSDTPEQHGTPRASLDVGQNTPQTWACHVCGYRNLSSGNGKCTLCGVARSDIVSRDAPSASSTINSTATIDPLESGNLLSCPTCTFLNHPSMTRCELCESPLTVTSTSQTISRPDTPVNAPRPATPVFGTGTPPFVRLSFRKGGDKPFYTALKLALKTKAWSTDTYQTPRRREADGAGTDTVSVNGSRTTTFGISMSA